jgi:predicted O-methyltransferase YrrM
VGRVDKAPEAVHALVKGVTGWLSEAEGDLLFALARQCRTGCIVEIGSFAGKSTTFLAAGSAAASGVTVYAIDPHIDPGTGRSRFPEFERQIETAGLTHIVRPIVGTSAQAAESFHEPIELLFIDGAHDEPSVRLDWDLWPPRLIPGGYVAIHDTLRWPGPSRVAEERIIGSSEFCGTGLVDSITYGRKRRDGEEPCGPFDRYRLRILKSIGNMAVRFPLPPAARTVGSRILRELQRRP